MGSALWWLSCLSGSLSLLQRDDLTPMDECVSAPIIGVVFLLDKILDKKFDTLLLNWSISFSLYPECGKYRVVRHRLWEAFGDSSVGLNLKLILRNLVVFPVDNPPIINFFALPLFFHVVANSGESIIATPPLAPFVGCVLGP